MEKTTRRKLEICMGLIIVEDTITLVLAGRLAL